MSISQNNIPVMAATVSILIASGQTISGALNCQGYRLKAIQTPSALTGTSFTVQGSIDGGTTYKQIYNIDGTPYSITAGANRLIKFIDDDFDGIQFIKLVSNATEASDRTIVCGLAG